MDGDAVFDEGFFSGVCPWSIHCKLAAVLLVMVAVALWQYIEGPLSHPATAVSRCVESGRGGVFDEGKPEKTIGAFSCIVFGSSSQTLLHFPDMAKSKDLWQSKEVLLSGGSFPMQLCTHILIVQHLCSLRRKGWHNSIIVTFVGQVFCHNALVQ